MKTEKNLVVNADAKNFAEVVSKKNVGETVTFPDGAECTILAYFVSQKDRNGNKTAESKGLQTRIDCIINGETFTDLSTEVIKNTYCKERTKRVYNKTQTEKETFLTLFEKLKKYEPKNDELNTILEYYTKEKKNRENNERINELNSIIKEKESKYNTLIEFNAKTQANGLKKEIDNLKKELEELIK